MPTESPSPRASTPRHRRFALPVFLRAVVRDPAAIGAIVPSSQALGRVLAAIVPRSATPTVVELGPGTGAVTAVIQRQLPDGGLHLAVEIDPEVADYLEETFPAVTVLRGDAARLPELLASAGADRAEAVVCSLPWSLFDEERQRGILDRIRATLAPGGAFSTFSYRHTAPLRSARRFRALLDEYFEEVTTSPTVWRNIPPALVYTCRRPTPAADPAPLADPAR